jgi:hypothetical protein
MEAHAAVLEGYSFRKDQDLYVSLQVLIGLFAFARKVKTSTWLPSTLGNLHDA